MLSLNCKECGNDFYVRNYRQCSAKYCSYKCGGIARNRIRYSKINEPICRICNFCKLQFTTTVKHYKRRKYCSSLCANGARRKALAPYWTPKMSKQEKLEKHKSKLKIYNKQIKCIQCSKIFYRNYKGKPIGYCSSKCIGDHKKDNCLSRKDLEAVLHENLSINDTCLKLKVSYHTFRKRLLLYGLTLNKKYKLRTDGYWGYTSAYNHKNIYQKAFGTLSPGVAIHHINGNKIDNALQNLIPLTTKQHSLAHKSLEKLALKLLTLGYIEFDKSKNVYILSEKGLNLCH